MNISRLINKLKEIVKKRMIGVLISGIPLLIVNFILILEHSKKLIPFWVLSLMFLNIFVTFENEPGKKKRLTRNEKLISTVLVFFILKIKDVRIEEKEKIGEYLNKIFPDLSPEYIADFLNKINYSDENAYYIKMSQKDVFYKNVLLKYLFRTALKGKMITVEDENNVREIAEKIKIGKAYFNKRKFFCEKAGYRFESTQTFFRNTKSDYSEFSVEQAFITLGLTSEATDDEIKKAKRRLSKEFHPDKTGSDSERFIEIMQAYKIIKQFRKMK
jgi:hypothetical protein